MKIRQVFSGLLLAAGLFCTARVPAADADVPQVKPAPEAIAAAQQEIAKLSDDDFNTRKAATTRLENLDLSLLPWLQNLLKENETTKALEPEVVVRLKEAIKGMQARVEAAKAGAARAALEAGSQVRLNLTQAKPDDIFRALEQQTGNKLEKGPSGASPHGQDFSYSGTYWGAVHRLLQLFPPAPAEAAAEDLSSRTPVALEALAGMPYAVRGVCDLTVVQVALKRQAGGDRLCLETAAQLEPRFKRAEIKLENAGLTLDGAASAAPADLAPPSGDSPGITNISFALDPKAPLPRLATINGTVSFTAYEKKVVPVALSGESTAVTLPTGQNATVTASDTTLTVKIDDVSTGRELGGGAVKIIGGGAVNVAGGFRAGGRVVAHHVVAMGGGAHEFGFGDNWYHADPAAWLNCYNAAGEKMTATANGVKSSFMNGAVEYEATLTTSAKVARVELSVPVALPKVTLPFSITDIQLPTVNRRPDAH